MKYLGACLFLLAGNEIISMAALLVMMGMFFWDIAQAKFKEERYE